jgi:membrane protein implicated in regulation of membrane protease activity
MVRQARVIVNASVMLLLFGSILWLVGDSLAEQVGGLGVAGMLGVAHGGLYCWRLPSRITRKGRRFEANKIPVKFLSIFEIALVAAASGHYVLIGLGVLLLLGIIADALSGYWITVLVGSFGAGSAATLTAYVIWYEYRHGRLYYQYDSRSWMGTERMLYGRGTVIDPLIPMGRILIDGETWNAVSKSSEPIGKDETVEVLSIEGLTLYVDRAP